MDTSLLERGAQLLRMSQRIVALTGAGISRPSGIPDFRSDSGIWAHQDPLEVASLQAFRRDPQRFYGWLQGLLAPILAAVPNPAHRALAELELRGKLRAVITQNIDGLHQAAGSRRVFELHGHLRTVTCHGCGVQAPTEPLLPTVRRGQAPRCRCGGAFKPDVVLFDELLPQGLVWLAQKALEECDLLLVAGTSLEVAPVCDMPLIALRRGVRLMVINYEQTHLDHRADVVLHEDVAVALPAMVSRAQG
ncbi:MAG: NAD-dependent deacylase [Oscillochloris sp.]|nr:NAD-dependent deacylase [Oscillochloris sp.]